MLQAGSLSHNYENWVKIGASQTILDWVKFGVPLYFDKVPEDHEFPNKQLSFSQSQFITAEITRLQQVGALEVCSSKPLCVSPISTVPKKGGQRLIIDLRYVNQHCHAPKFNNEDIRVVEQYIEYKDLLATVDLKDGFHHILVLPEYRKYLGFKWQGVYYQWRVLCFGLSLSPMFFAKIVRPVVTFLRAQDIRLQAYVDDFLLAAQKSCFADHLDMLLHTLMDLGWHINQKKSATQPEYHKVYIGYVIKTDGPQGFPVIQITSERIQKLKRSLRNALKKECISARNLARIAGQCVAMSFVIRPAKLLLRNVYKLLSIRGSWEDSLSITAEARKDLLWWEKYISDWNHHPVVVRPVQAILTTDASHLGWGAWMDNMEASGQWNVRLSQRSSNYRELMAILLALKAFLVHVKGKSIQVQTDNISAMAYIVNQGGPSPELTSIAKAIWAIVLANSMHIQVRHLSGVSNSHADRLSRLKDRFNWMLHPNMFKLLDLRWGPHTVDRFADYQNTQLPRYNSRYMDPYSEGIDALAQINWHTENNYVNPPFCLLPRVIDKIVHERAKATLIAPLWIGQPWFHKMKRLLVAPPIKIPRKTNAMVFMGPEPEVRHNKGWKIFAWRLCGNNDC